MVTSMPAPDDLDRLLDPAAPRSESEQRLAALLTRLQDGLQEEPAPELVRAHLEVIHSAVAGQAPSARVTTADELAARRGLPRRTSALRMGVAAAVFFIALTSGLALAGSLPSPVQRVVADTARYLGINLPSPDGGVTEETGVPLTPAPSRTFTPPGASPTPAPRDGQEGTAPQAPGADPVPVPPPAEAGEGADPGAPPAGRAPAPAVSPTPTPGGSSAAPGSSGTSTPAPAPAPAPESPDSGVPGGPPGPPEGVPGPPAGVPGPPDGVPGPPAGVPGPPDGVPGPPAGVPGRPGGPPGRP